MDYLVYIEHNAENLQFYLWYKDYVRRFNALPENEKKLSPEWTPEKAEVPNLVKDPETQTKNKTKRETISAMMEIGYDPKEPTLFGDGRMTLAPARAVSIIKDNGSTVAPSITFSLATAPSAAEVTAQAGLKWQPCTMYRSSSEL
jgi:hypothetical protein